MIKFRTRSGAVYALDLVNKTWERQNGLDGCNLRSSSGKYCFMRTGINVGESVELWCPPYETSEDGESISFRRITTTPVVEIWA